MARLRKYRASSAFKRKTERLPAKDVFTSSSSENSDTEETSDEKMTEVPTADPSQPPASGECLFLNMLSPEMRNKIYDQCFPDIFIVKPTSARGTQVIFELLGPNDPNKLALSLVNRQIHDETNCMLMARSSFSGQVRHLSHMFGGFNEEQLKNVVRVGIVLWTRTVFPAECEGLGSHESALLDTLSTMKNLERICIIWHHVPGQNKRNKRLLKQIIDEEAGSWPRRLRQRPIQVEEFRYASRHSTRDIRDFARQRYDI